MMMIFVNEEACVSTFIDNMAKVESSTRAAEERMYTRVAQLSFVHVIFHDAVTIPKRIIFHGLRSR